MVYVTRTQGTPEYATILAFDVKIDSDARRHADENGVRIFTADIIYHLFDQFTAHMDRLMEQRRQDAKNLAVFPCIVKVRVGGVKIGSELRPSLCCQESSHVQLGHVGSRQGKSLYATSCQVTSSDVT